MSAKCPVPESYRGLLILLQKRATRGLVVEKVRNNNNNNNKLKEQWSRRSREIGLRIAIRYNAKAQIAKDTASIR